MTHNKTRYLCAEDPKSFSSLNLFLQAFYSVFDYIPFDIFCQVCEGI